MAIEDLSHIEANDEAIKLLEESSGICSINRGEPSEMQVIQSEDVVMYDCDDTLVMWFTECDPTLKVKIICPYGGSETWLKPHARHIDLLKKHHGRGKTVIVWSAGGYKWAQAVVEALGLQDYVHFVMTKPMSYVDDLEAKEILGSRIYLKDI